MTKLSVVINTLNEAANLPRALASIANFASEVVVVDMKSDDETRQIAEKFGAKVFEHERTNYVEPARNFAISKATGDWILILDADEELPVTLLTKIKSITESDSAGDYYRLPRKNIIFGKWIKHSRWWPDFNIRLFKKGAVSWNEIIHSVPITQGRGVDLAADEKLAIIHHHYESISQYIQRLDRYTTIQANQRNKEGYLFTWRDLITKSSGEFFGRYFEGEGFRDGLHGLVLAALQSFSEFVVLLKAWEIEKFEQKSVTLIETSAALNQLKSDFNYWQADTQLKEKGGFILRIRRKLRI